MNLYEAIKKNSDDLDLSIEISPVQSNDVWLKFLVNYVHGVLVEGSAKVFIEGSDFGIPEYPQISKLSYNGGDECNYDRGWDVEPENKEVFNYICKSLVDYRDRHPYSLDEAEGRPSIPMDVKELVENIIYDDRNLDLRTAQFEGSNFVVEPRTNLDEALFDKIVQRISDQFNTYGISYDSIEDVDNNVVVYDCYMSDEAYKEYKDNSDDYKQEDEEFYMLNKDTDEKVRVYKDGNRWYDSDGNRYMGYLSKEDVKAYFKGNWEELNESEDNSIEVIKNVIKSKNLPNGTKVSSITDDTFNSIVKDVQSKMPNSDEKEVRNKVAGTLYGMFEESEDFYVIPKDLQKIINSFPTDIDDPYYYEHGYEVPDELLELSLRPPENMRVRDWMRIEDPAEYQLNKIPKNLTFKAIHENPSLFKKLAHNLDSDPRDVIYNQLEDMYGEDFVSNIYESDDGEEIEKVDATEKYWDATTLKQDAFLRVMKFNFVEPHGCQYIITNDANELERFRADSDEDAINYYDEFKSGIDSGLIEIMPADLNIKSIVPREDFNETELSDRKFCDLPDDFQKKVINYLVSKKRGTVDEIVKYLMYAKVGDFNDTSLLTQDEFVDLYEV